MPQVIDDKMLAMLRGSLHMLPTPMPTIYGEPVAHVIADLVATIDELSERNGVMANTLLAALQKNTESFARIATLEAAPGPAAVFFTPEEIREMKRAHNLPGRITELEDRVVSIEMSRAAHEPTGVVANDPAHPDDGLKALDVEQLEALRRFLEPTRFGDKDLNNIEARRLLATVDARTKQLLARGKRITELEKTIDKFKFVKEKAADEAKKPVTIVPCCPKCHRNLAPAVPIGLKEYNMLEERCSCGWRHCYRGPNDT